MKNIIIASLVGVILTLICSIYVERELNKQLQLILKSQQQKHYQDIKFLQKPSLISTISTQDDKSITRENKTLKNEFWKVSEEVLKEVLSFNSEYYDGFKTPPRILSGVHFKECKRKTSCSRGSSGELSPFQIRPLYWKSEKFCRGLDPNNFIHSIKCADKILYANYLTHNRDWRLTLEFYNCGNKNLQRCKDYASDIIKFIN